MLRAVWPDYGENVGNFYILGDFSMSFVDLFRHLIDSVVMVAEAKK